MPHSRPSPADSQGSSVRSTTFERTVWVAQERVLEEPRPRPAEPLELAINEHVVDVPLDGDAIVRSG